MAGYHLPPIIPNSLSLYLSVTYDQNLSNGYRRAHHQGMRDRDAQILVAEDDDAERESLIELLHLWNYEASAASDGLEALKEISSLTFDLVVSDLYMPHLSGLDLLKELREHFPWVRCIIVSGADDQLGELEALRLGAWSFFKKPVDADQLKAAVRNCLDARKKSELPLKA